MGSRRGASVGWRFGVEAGEEGWEEPRKPPCALH